MTTRRRQTAALLSVASLAAVVATAGCSADPPPVVTTTAVVVNTPPAAAPPSPAPAPTGPNATPQGQAPGSLSTTTPAPTPTGKPTVTRSLPSNQISIDGQQVARSTAAAAAARTFMQAFARPDLSETAWWARVGPLLTPSGRQAVYGTDPALIPVTTVTGPAKVLPNAEKDARIVTVPTDIGDYTLFLAWDRASSRWLVQTVQPPDGVK